MKKLVEFTLGCLLILLYVGATLLYAQNSALNDFIITGVVKDKDNRKKLDNVNVSVVGTNIGTMTNADGDDMLEYIVRLPKMRITVYSLLGKISEFGSLIPL